MRLQVRTLAVTLLLSGCCVSDGTFENVQDAVRDHGNELLQLRDMIAQVCSAPDPPSECDELVRRFNALQSSYSEIKEGTR